jgi:hypothetical protein
MVRPADARKRKLLLDKAIRLTDLEEVSRWVNLMPASDTKAAMQRLVREEIAVTFAGMMDLLKEMRR